MRITNENYQAAYDKNEIEPRYVLAIEFDDDGTDVTYITSHSDSQLPAGLATEDKMLGMLLVDGLSEQTQRIVPERAQHSVGTFSVKIQDYNNTLSTKIKTKNDAGAGLRHRKVVFYQGESSLTAWADYEKVLTHIIDDPIEYKDGVYRFTAPDIKRQSKDKIFTINQGVLTSSITADTALPQTIPVTISGAENKFKTIYHDDLYDSRPNEVVGYIKIDDEYIAHSGWTDLTYTSLQVVKRGAFNTRSVAHEVTAIEDEQKKKVDEVIYLQSQAARTILGLLTGIDSGGKNLLTDPFDLLLTNPDWDTGADSITVSESSENSPADGIKLYTVDDQSTGYAFLQSTVSNSDGYVDKENFTISLIIRHDASKTGNIGLRLIFDGGNNYGTVVLNMSTGAVSNDQSGDFTLEERFGEKIGDFWLLKITGRYSGAGSTTVARWRLFPAYVGATSTQAIDVCLPFAGKGDVQGWSFLPSHWHLNIDPSYVAFDDFADIGVDLWGHENNTGRMVRFIDEKDQTGKQFIEEQILLWIECFMPIKSDGSYSLRRTNKITPYSDYVAYLDEDQIVNYSGLQYKQKEVINNVLVNWNWLPQLGIFTKPMQLVDNNSRSVYKDAPLKTYDFRGVFTGVHTDTDMVNFFNSIIDRYSEPPLRLDITAQPAWEKLQVGDVIRVKHSAIYDTYAGATLDRSFEIQKKSFNGFTGQVKLSLFGGIGQANLTPISSTYVMQDSFYTSLGTELSTVLTISGGAVTANGSLAAGVYYYDGDLTINSGITVTVSGTVELRIKGSLQINGDINGDGNGAAGAASTAAQYGAQGSAGAFGEAKRSPMPGAYLQTNSTGSINYIFPNGSVVDQIYKSTDIGVPSITNPDGLSLIGLRSSLIGSGGGAGHGAGYRAGGPFTYLAAGGAGGAGGAGLRIIARGCAFGASGSISLNGGAGSNPAAGAYNSRNVYAGPGRGGSAGACEIWIDGNASTPVQTYITLNAGANGAYTQTPLYCLPRGNSEENPTRQLAAGEYGAICGAWHHSLFADQTSDNLFIGYIPKALDGFEWYPVDQESESVGYGNKPPHWEDVDGTDGSDFTNALNVVHNVQDHVDLSTIETVGTSLSGNPDCTIVAADGRPAGVKAMYGTVDPSVVSFLDAAKTIVKLFSASDTSIGCGWPAFRVTPGNSYTVFIRVKSDQPKTNGFYFAMPEYDSELATGITHISIPGGGGESGVIAGTRNTYFIQNAAIGSTWEEHLFTITPEPTAKWVSPVFLNWSGIGNGELHIDKCVVVSNATLGADWGPSGNITNVPYDYIYNNSDAAALGFNPTFSNWTGTLPNGWSQWSTLAPTKDTTIKNIGEQSVKFVGDGIIEGGIYRATGASFALPVGTFLVGTVDVYISAGASGGNPGILVDLHHASGVNGYTRTHVPADISVTAGWQRIPFIARPSVWEDITKIGIYVMGSYITAQFGGAAFNGTVYFDNLHFALQDRALDNSYQQWTEITNIPSGQIYNSDAATALGFNPSFSVWTSTFPDGWVNWANGSTRISKETTTVRIGDFAARFNQATSAEAGMTRTNYEDHPAGTFISGSLDVYIHTYTSGGNPGIVVDLGHASGVGGYTRTVVAANTALTGQWQRLTFIAEPSAWETLTYIRVYVMAGWNGLGGISFAGDVTFDNLQLQTLNRNLANSDQQWSDVGGTGKPDDNADVTLDQLSGSSVNVANYKYSVFEGVKPTDIANVRSTYQYSTNAYFGGHSLEITATDSDGYVYLGDSGTDYNIKLTTGRKWLVSAYVKADLASTNISINLNTNNGFVDGSVKSIGTSWTRQTWEFDLTSGTGSAGTATIMRLDVDTNGRTVQWDGIMIEEQIGNQTTPSAYVLPSADLLETADLIDNAHLAANVNLVNDPNFVKDKLGEEQTWSGVTASAVGENGTAGVRLVADGTINDYYNQAAGATIFFPADKGDTIFVKARIFVSNDFNGTFGIASTAYNESKVVIDYPGYQTSNLTKGSWYDFQGSFTLTGNATAFFTLRLTLREDATLGTIDVSNIFVSRVQDNADVTGDNETLSQTIYFYKESATTPTTPTAGDGSFNFSTGAVTPPTGWSVTPPATGGRLWRTNTTFYLTGPAGVDDGTNDYSTPYDVFDNHYMAGSLEVKDAMTIGSSTYGDAGIQMLYNSGNPKAYLGDGDKKFLEVDTNTGDVRIGEDTEIQGTAYMGLQTPIFWATHFESLDGWYVEGYNGNDPGLGVNGLDLVLNYSPITHYNFAKFKRPLAENTWAKRRKILVEVIIAAGKAYAGKSNLWIVQGDYTVQGKGGGSATDKCWGFKITHNSTTSNWEVKGFTINGVNESTTSSTVIGSDAAIRKAKLYGEFLYAASDPSVKFYLDGSLIGTLTINIPTGSDHTDNWFRAEYTTRAGDVITTPTAKHTISLMRFGFWQEA